MSVHTVVGRSLTRVDALAKVTGSAVYTSDFEMVDMAHAAIVRSTFAHGRLVEIDTSDPQDLDGVIAVITAADLAELGIIDPYFGLTLRDQPILTDEIVRYSGEALAAVVAETPDLARRAAKLVQVVVDELEPVYDLEESMHGLVLVHSERDSSADGHFNVAAQFEFTDGDVELALDGAHYVHEGVYTFPMVGHYAMEPHCCIASWSGDALEVVSSTQQPFKVRADLARMFGLRQHQVRVRVPYVGGGYGGKLLSKYEPLTAALSRKAGRPVKLVLSADESFRTVARHGSIVRMRTGIDSDGYIVGRDTRILLDTGAYADKGPGVAKKAAYRAKGPYLIPSFRSVALAVYTNKVPAGAFRGYSTPQVVWAGESAINEIAHHLGVDPLTYRQEKLIPRGEEFMPNDTPMDADLAQGITIVATELPWTPQTKQTKRGQGLATGVKDGGGGPSRAEAEVRLYADGSVEVLAGTVEIGQGVQTVYAQVVAEELGCDVSAVKVRLPDTSTTPFDHGTEASRSTVLVGNAVRKAASHVKQQLLDMLEKDERHHRLHLDGASIVTDGQKRTELSRLLAQNRGLPVTGEFELGPVVSLAYHDTLRSANAPLGTPSNFYEVGHGAVEIEVDSETGQIDILRYVSVADVGKALNPRTCEAQDAGAAIMALGHTLFEELVFDDGELVNGNLAEYRLPLASDLPSQGLQVVLLENGDGPGPYGAKGAGEAGIISMAPAVAEALFQACGIRIRQLPLNPQVVWRAINRAQQE